MQRFVYIYLIVTGILASACKKQNTEIQNDYLAGITVVNAIASNGSNIKANFTGHQVVYSQQRDIDFYNWDGLSGSGIKVFGVPINKQIPIEVVLSSDTLKKVFYRQAQFNKGDAFTLFLFGDKNNIDSLFIQDFIPVRTDSTAGFRFVHLSPNAGDLSINLEGNAIGSELPSLTYKSVSGFKSYPAKAKNEEYVFEVRRVSDGELLGSFSFNPFSSRVPRFKNVTLIVRGLINADGPGFEIIRLNNY